MERIDLYRRPVDGERAFLRVDRLRRRKISPWICIRHGRARAKLRRRVGCPHTTVHVRGLAGWAWLEEYGFFRTGSR